MNGLSRYTALRIAAILAFANGAMSLFIVLPLLVRGEASLNQSIDSPPYFVVLLGFILAILAMIAAYGTWMQQRWGIILNMVVHVVNALSAVPGIFFAPTTPFWFAAALTVVMGIVVVILCLWRDRQPAIQ